MRLGRERAAAMAAAGFQRDGGNMAVMWCGEVRVFAQKWWEEGNVVGRGIAGSGRGLKTIENEKKGQGLHEDTRGQWTSVGQLHGSQLFGVLWVKCTRHRMPRPSPNHPRKRNRRLGASVISWGGFSQDKRPLPRLVDWPPFALEMEGFLFCTRLGCWHGANEPRCQGRESRFEVAGGSKALQVFVSCVINPTLLAQESVQTNTINHQHQQRNKTRTLLPFSALSIFWFSPSMAPQDLSCWSWAVPPLPLFSVCCLVGQSSWKHRLVIPEMRQLREMQSHGTCKGSSFQSVSTHQTLTNSCHALIL